MSTVARKLVTAEDLLAMPDEGLRRELVHGEVIETTPAGDEHGRLTGKLTVRIGSFILDHELGQIYASETGFLLRRDPDTVRCPDAAFVSTDRLGDAPASTGFVPVAPDLAVEVVSPSDTWQDVEAKVREYLEAGTGVVWVLSPRPGQVHVYRPGGQAVVLDRDDTLTGDPILPGLTIPVREIFEE